MPRFFFAYFIMLIVFIVLDLLWLGIIAKPLYHRQIGFWLAENVNWWAAIIFYLLFVLGILVFVVTPGAQAPLWRTLALGAFFGLVTYAAYDLTNLATVKNWPVLITVVDLIWGAIICTLVTLAGVLCLR